MSLPVLTAACRARPQASVAVLGRPGISVAALGRPSVASVTVAGPQGAPGERGIPGPPGVARGVGQITYTNRSLEPDDVFEAGARAQVRFAPDGPPQDGLNPPFEGHAFWIEDAIVPRAMGDLYDIQTNLIVTVDTAGGYLRLDADVGSSLGPIASDTQVLFEGAGRPERVTFRLRVQVLANFLANGCRIFLTSSVRITTVSETILLAPASTP